jgi:hypothetical protein
VPDRRPRRSKERFLVTYWDFVATRN